jgi:hypothetical protein
MLAVLRAAFEPLEPGLMLTLVPVSNAAGTNAPSSSEQKSYFLLVQTAGTPLVPVRNANRD